MAKLICLLVLAFAACMVAGLPHQDVNTIVHRTARAADPDPQYYGYSHGHGFGHGHGLGHGHGYDYALGHDNLGHGGIPLAGSDRHVHFERHCTHYGCHADAVIH